MTRPAIKLPDSKGGWASLVLGCGLMLIGLAHWMQGSYEQASLDFSGAFGTLGLPSLLGTGYHVEVRRDQPRPVKTYQNMGRVEDCDDELE